MKHLNLLYLIVICLCYCQMIDAQCDNSLVDKAVLQSGSDAVYLREFKVKFDRQGSRKEVPKAKYPVLLSKNTAYRFNVCDAVENEGKAVLELYLKNELVGSTYDEKTGTHSREFDFKCDKAAGYELVMFFEQGKPGCAVGILSMITEKQPEDEKELDILYADADNPIIIYDDEDEYANIDVSIDNGSITRVKDVNYIIHPDEEGIVMLNIRVLNRDGTLREFKQKRYAVLTLGKPYAIIRGIKDGKIDKETLIKSGRLDLWFSEEMKCNFQVISFTLSDRNDLISGVSSTSDRLSKSQREWVKKLPSGTRLYIKNIQVRTPESVVTYINSIEFELE